MSWPKTSKPKERYYLFAGMGGRASRRKQRIFLIWSVIVAILVSASLALILFLFNRMRVT